MIETICIDAAIGGAAPVSDADARMQRELRSHGAEWTEFFSRWLGTANQQNAGLLWWAQTTTAKNPLSSPLYERMMRVLAVCELARTSAQTTLHVTGGTPAQIAVIKTLTRDLPVRAHCTSAWSLHWRRALRKLGAAVRATYQCVRVLGVFLVRRKHCPVLDLCLFTYADSPPRGDLDLYFGTLDRLISRISPNLRMGYAVYVSRPFRERLKELDARDHPPRIAIFDLLRPVDYVWALAKTLGTLLFNNFRVSGSTPLEKHLAPLLREALVDDVRVGGYLHNLLVYRSMLRLVATKTIKTVIYPYENKALEKALLLAVRRSPGKIHCVGYQHTSLSPRHINLLFEEGEAHITPFPDRVVTLGNVTAEFLARRGNYPSGVLTAGCALRQRWSEMHPRRTADPKRPRILLALSSSPGELRDAVSFCMTLQARIPGAKLAIRTHPSFPTSLLPADLFAWQRENASDFSGTDLSENLQWCDITLYVSSTVALEALMVGCPVINLRLSDPIDPDPIVEVIPNTWKVHTADEVADLVHRICSATEESRREQSQSARDWLLGYFAPVSDDAIRRFVQ